MHTAMLRPAVSTDGVEPIWVASNVAKHGRQPLSQQVVVPMSSGRPRLGVRVIKRVARGGTDNAPPCPHSVGFDS